MSGSQYTVPRSHFAEKTTSQKLPWPKDACFRILSIDGGGIRGMLPAAFLSALEAQIPERVPITRFFDMLAGTSTGGIIALGLGSGLSASEILTIYSEHGGKVFPRPNAVRRMLRPLSSIILNRYDRAELESLTKLIFHAKKIGASCVRLCIPATEAIHFEPFIFKTAHHPRYRLDYKKPMWIAACSTAAAPTYFKPFDYEGYSLVDGGLWANNPAMIAVVDALACYDIRPEQIRVLSLSCLEDKRSIGFSKTGLGGQFFWRDALFWSMSVQSQNVNGQVGLLIGKENFLRVAFPQMSPPIELDDWRNSVKQLPRLGTQLAEVYHAEIRERFFFREAAKFEPCYEV